MSLTPSSLYQLHEPWASGSPASAPILVIGLDGWVDAGLGASSAMSHLIDSGPTTSVATFDTEPLIDQRARRPVARLEDGVTVELTWPTLEIVAGTDLAGSDVLYFTGPEPDFMWPTFIASVVELVGRLGVRMVVGLGAFPAPTPHTRSVRLASTVPPQSADLAGRIGTVRGTLEVPAGIQAALEVALGAAGIPVIGLWARVPHYISAMAYPEASASLIEGLCAVSGALLDTTELRVLAAKTRRQIDDLITGNADHMEMVRQLELAIDAEDVSTGFDMEVPSGDEIAAELEQFLRGEGR